MKTFIFKNHGSGVEFHVYNAEDYDTAFREARLHLRKMWGWKCENHEGIEQKTNPYLNNHHDGKENSSYSPRRL
jgi:hypothetical protein